MIRRLDGETAATVHASYQCPDVCAVVAYGRSLLSDAASIRIDLAPNLVSIKGNGAGIDDLKQYTHPLLQALRTLSQDVVLRSKSARRLMDAHVYEWREGNTTRCVDSSFGTSGTQLLVKELFWGLPVRRATLGKQIGHCLESLKRTIVLQKGVRFTINGKSYSPRATYEERLCDVYGFKRAEIAVLDGATWVLKRKTRFDPILEEGLAKVAPVPYCTVLLAFKRKTEATVNTPAPAIRVDAMPDNSYRLRRSAEKEISCLDKTIKKTLTLTREQLKQALIIGQFADSFIALRISDALFMMDQHAAAERANLERLQREKTSLLGAFGPVEVSYRCEDTQSIRRYNVHIEKFQVRQLPRLIADKQIRYFKDIDAIIEEAMKYRACRSAVKAGDPLSLEEMRRIVDALAECRHPWICAHGRPTVEALFATGSQ